MSRGEPGQGGYQGRILNPPQDEPDPNYQKVLDERERLVNWKDALDRRERQLVKRENDLATRELQVDRKWRIVKRRRDWIQRRQSELEATERTIRRLLGNV